MLVEWVVILTIGCLPPEEQPKGANCILETKIVEAPVFDEVTAKRIVENFAGEMEEALPGSFVIARYEKRRKPEPKKEK